MFIVKMLRPAALAACVYLAAGCVGLFAQATSQIQGVVQDASGSAVPGADVKATQTETGALRAVTSGSNGEYVLSNLPVGGLGAFVTLPRIAASRLPILRWASARPASGIREYAASRTRS